jgi:hypothetical protein
MDRPNETRESPNALSTIDLQGGGFVSHYSIVSYRQNFRAGRFESPEPNEPPIAPRQKSDTKSTMQNKDRVLAILHDLD